MREYPVGSAISEQLMPLSWFTGAGPDLKENNFLKNVYNWGQLQEIW